jgi:CheY-like chemotaxis protein
MKRILFIEDEQDIQEVAQLALEAIGGYTVEVCSSGAEALDRVVEFAPDLILLDVMMPDMDGPTTLKALRKMPETANTPIIFMTAKSQAREIQRFKKLSTLDVITKPFDPMALSDQIAGIFKNWTGNDAEV